MWKRYRANKNYNNLVEYKLALNKVTDSYRKAKSNFEGKLAKNIKSNPKAFYNYVRSQSKIKDKVGPLSDENGNLLSDSRDMCKLLNNYFGSIFTVEKMEKIPEARSIFKGNHADMLRDVEISQGLVYERLKRLKKNKAPGFDNLDSEFLNKTAESISNPLTKIFLNSFECGIVPADWKCANVCSIFKKGKKNNTWKLSSSQFDFSRL